MWFLFAHLFPDSADCVEAVWTIFVRMPEFYVGMPNFIQISLSSWVTTSYRFS